MSKIAIVGVEGSGKSTLMAAFGEKYERPDENGYGLKAASEETFRTVKLLADRLRHGQWPGATATGTLTALDWTLYRRTARGRADVCGVSFLDFAGETYRLAFGMRADEDVAANRKQIEALTNHIETSDGLIVLVNLRDVINGDRSSARTCEMMWITQSLVEFAVRDCRLPRVALAFSQAGLYRDTIKAAGGLKGAYAKYLPHIEGLYPDMPLMALSAVDQTVIDADGYELPAPDYSSEGFGDLLQWIVSTELREDDLDEATEERRGSCGRQALSISTSPERPQDEGVESVALRGLCDQYRVMLKESAEFHSDPEQNRPELAKKLVGWQSALYGISGGARRRATVRVAELNTLISAVIAEFRTFRRRFDKVPFFIEHRRQKVELIAKKLLPDSVAEIFYKSVTIQTEDER